MLTGMSWRGTGGKRELSHRRYSSLTFARSSQQMRIWVDNAGVDVGVMLSAVNAELCDCWRLERRLAGGWNEGAYLLSRPDGCRAVLKWRAGEPERLLGAR